MTAAGYVVTTCAVHVLHYESEASMDRRSLVDPAMEDIDDVDHGGSADESGDSAENAADVDTEDEDEDTAATLRLVSLVSIFAAAVAGSALILLAVMDTVRYHRAHVFLLRICFAGLVVQSTGTVVVYARDVLALMVYAYHPTQHRPRIGSRRFTVGLWYVFLFIEAFSGKARSTILCLGLRLTGHSEQCDLVHSYHPDRGWPWTCLHRSSSPRERAISRSWHSRVDYCFRGNCIPMAFRRLSRPAFGPNNFEIADQH